MSVPLDRPVTPDEAAALKPAVLPGAVFAAFNKMIALHFDGRSARFTQEQVIEAIQQEDPGITRVMIFAGRMLDVEPAYREAGWDVEFDRPGWNEGYQPTFTFRRKR